MKQYLTVSVNFPDGREYRDLDCGELDHDLTWEEQVERACEMAKIALAENGQGPAWSSMVLVVTNTPN